MVGGLLVLDITLLSAWQIRDPLQRKVETFPLEAPRHNDDDVHIRPELEHCESEHNTIWLGEFLLLLNSLTDVPTLTWFIKQELQQNVKKI